jgi:hypothetical protein
MPPKNYQIKITVAGGKGFKDKIKSRNYALNSISKDVIIKIEEQFFSFIKYRFTIEYMI